MKILVTHPNLQQEPDNDQEVVSLQELSRLDDAICIYIHLADCMDYVPPSERYKLLQVAIKKMRYNAVITVSGVDILTVGQQIYAGLLEIDKANSVLYNSRLSADSINNVVTNMESMGLELINAKLDGLYYSIKMRRKKNV